MHRLPGISRLSCVHARGYRTPRRPLPSRLRIFLGVFFFLFFVTPFTEKNLVSSCRSILPRLLYRHAVSRKLFSPSRNCLKVAIGLFSPERSHAELDDGDREIVISRNVSLVTFLTLRTSCRETSDRSVSGKQWSVAVFFFF